MERPEQFMHGLKHVEANLAAITSSAIESIICTEVAVISTVVRGVQASEMASILGGESKSVGVWTELVGDLQGWVLMSMTEQSAAELSRMLLGESCNKVDDVPVEDALKEVANIISGAAVRVLGEGPRHSASAREHLDLTITIPWYKSGDIQSIISKALGDYAGQLLIMGTAISVENFKADVTTMLTDDGVDRLLGIQLQPRMGRSKGWN